MSALDEIITRYQDAGGLSRELPPVARAELAALRASVATLTAQNAEQAQQIEAAREIFMSHDLSGWFAWHVKVDAWLSAAAPAPQDAQEKPE